MARSATAPWGRVAGVVQHDQCPTAGQRPGQQQLTCAAGEFGVRWVAHRDEEVVDDCGLADRGVLGEAVEVCVQVPVRKVPSGPMSPVTSDLARVVAGRSRVLSGDASRDRVNPRRVDRMTWIDVEAVG